MYGVRVREAKPDEKCADCGQPARAARVTPLGDVPTCKTPAEYTAEIQSRYAGRSRLNLFWGGPRAGDSGTQ